VRAVLERRRSLEIGDVELHLLAGVPPTLVAYGAVIGPQSQAQEMCDKQDLDVLGLTAHVRVKIKRHRRW
jgi:hypothetical protein